MAIMLETFAYDCHSVVTQIGVVLSHLNTNTNTRNTSNCFKEFMAPTILGNGEKQNYENTTYSSWLRTSQLRHYDGGAQRNTSTEQNYFNDSTSSPSAINNQVDISTARFTRANAPTLDPLVEQTRIAYTNSVYLVYMLSFAMTSTAALLMSIYVIKSKWRTTHHIPKRLFSSFEAKSRRNIVITNSATDAFSAGSL